MLPPPDSVSQPFYDPQQQPQAFSPLQQPQQQPGGDYMGGSDGYANGGYLPPGQADQSYYSWAPPQQQEAQAAGSSRWGTPPPAAADNTIRWAPLPLSSVVVFRDPCLAVMANPGGHPVPNPTGCPYPYLHTCSFHTCTLPQL